MRGREASSSCADHVGRVRFKKQFCNRGEVCINALHAETSMAWCASTPSFEARMPARFALSNHQAFFIEGFDSAGGQNVELVPTKHSEPGRLAELEGIWVYPMDASNHTLAGGQHVRSGADHRISFLNTPVRTSSLGLHIKVSRSFFGINRPDIKGYVWRPAAPQPL